MEGHPMFESCPECLHFCFSEKVQWNLVVPVVRGPAPTLPCESQLSIDGGPETPAASSAATEAAACLVLG